MYTSRAAFQADIETNEAAKRHRRSAMRKSVIDRLCDQINALNGVKYGQKGYMYFADIRGDGRNRRSVWVTINNGGGVSYAPENGRTYNETAARLRKLLENANG